ncbi:MAG: class I SAM-dependent methyltransferase [Bacteroidetes bacterium]|nr:MAG: class I SAM-dependent methyltransferase [Bacteroidota bacterium]
MKLTFSVFLILFLGAGIIGCGSPTPELPQRPAPRENATLKQESELQAAQDTADLEEIVENYEAPDRGNWQKPGLVIQKMGDLSDKTVADIGFGSGFFSRRLAQIAEKVIAVEIDPRLIEYMDSVIALELAEPFQRRIETRLGTPTDSKLKDGEADIILLVNTYAWLNDRVGYLKHLRKKLAPGGKIVIVDFKKKRIPQNQGFPDAKYRIPLYVVENELEAAGFLNVVSDDQSLDYQYIVIATP